MKKVFASMALLFAMCSGASAQTPGLPPAGNEKARQEFADSKAAGQTGSAGIPVPRPELTTEGGFMQLPIGVEEDGIPFG